MQRRNLPGVNTRAKLERRPIWHLPLAGTPWAFRNRSNKNARLGRLSGNLPGDEMCADSSVVGLLTLLCRGHYAAPALSF